MQAGGADPIVVCEQDEHRGRFYGRPAATIRALEGPREILTVGHSTHPIGRFVELLQGAGVAVIADVRRYPGSRRNPQFGADPLARSLAEAGIGYEQLGAELGGRRSSPAPASGSRWRNPSFAAYAEHTKTEEFKRGLARLERRAAEARLAVMCAEAQWTRCHRRLIADVLVGRGWVVLHLRPDGNLEQHLDLIGPPGAGIRLT